MMAKSTIPISIDVPRTEAERGSATAANPPTRVPAALARSALLRLPDHERDVLVLRVFHGQSCAAIARQFGQPEALIRQRQLDALKHLRQLTQQDTPAAS